MLNVEITITHDRFPEIIAKLPNLAHDMVAKAAYEVEEISKQICPVRTGALKNSINTEFLEPALAAVGPNMDYSIYVEYGTYKMAAQPYMRPAADVVRPKFIKYCENVLKWL